MITSPVTSSKTATAWYHKQLPPDLQSRDLEPFAYPKMKDLRRVGVRSVCLGSFIPWDVKQQVQITEVPEWIKIEGSPEFVARIRLRGWELLAACGIAIPPQGERPKRRPGQH